MTYHQIVNKSNTIGATSGTGIAHPSGAPEFIPGLTQLVYPMFQVSLDFPFLIATSVFSNVYLRTCKTKQKQSRETWNIGYTRGRNTKQKQSRETWSIGYTRGRKTKQKQSRETWVFVLCFFLLCTLCSKFLWIVFVLFFFLLCTICSKFLWIVFVLFFFLLCILCSKFLWIFHF
jgi:hypothetical protein